MPTGLLKQGGRARDARPGRDVAIKILPTDLATDPDLRTRFGAGARSTAGSIIRLSAHYMTSASTGWPSIS